MELLSEAMKHAEMEIYNLVSKIADLIDDYESDERGSEVVIITMQKECAFQGQGHTDAT